MTPGRWLKIYALVFGCGTLLKKNDIKTCFYPVLKS